MDKERIDGFRSAFAVSDHYALEFMRFLQGQGIRVPEDVQIIGFDDTLASRESVPALTTIHQDAALRARTAIRRLEALRDGTPCDAGILIAQFLLTAGGFPAQVLGLYTADDAILRVWGRGTSASWRSLICPWRSAPSCPHGCAARNTPLSPFGQVLAR